MVDLFIAQSPLKQKIDVVDSGRLLLTVQQPSKNLFSLVDAVCTDDTRCRERKPYPGNPSVRNCSDEYLIRPKPFSPSYEHVEATAGETVGVYSQQVQACLNVASCLNTDTVENGRMEAKKRRRMQREAAAAGAMG